MFAKKSLILIFAALGIGACSSKDKISKSDTGSSMEAKQVAIEEEAAHVVEFDFKKGSSHLTPAAKSDIKKLISNARSQGAIKEIKVITWGDSEYPSVHTRKLASGDVKLVQERNKSIQKYINTQDKKYDVELYSMAERPGLIQEMLNTSDARIKKSLETAGVPTTDTAVKTPSKASKSIVMVIPEK
ncbi:MAG: hypothetical protein AAGB31_13140 [Bdellovibrio sp.]